ncbi:unnamed protein product [Heterobilharzia americana]|nr:unnamed protein product [Heterobilharzia americana]
MVSGAITENNGTLVTFQDRRLECWAEHFEARSNWTTETFQLPNIQPQPGGDADVGLPTLLEVEKAVSNPKRYKAAGPDILPPEVYKDRGRKLLIKVSKVLATSWESKVMPSDWSIYLIIPINKKGEKSCDKHGRTSLTLDFIVI